MGELTAQVGISEFSKKRGLQNLVRKRRVLAKFRTKPDTRFRTKFYSWKTRGAHAVAHIGHGLPPGRVAVGVQAELPEGGRRPPVEATRDGGGG